METGSNFLLEKSWDIMGFPETKLIFACTYENN